ncbi:MAG TPA: hypothetical protein VF598_02640, partial [Hymenobacter sp.]
KAPIYVGANILFNDNLGRVNSKIPRELNNAVRYTSDVSNRLATSEMRKACINDLASIVTAAQLHAEAVTSGNALVSASTLAEAENAYTIAPFVPNKRDNPNIPNVLVMSAWQALSDIAKPDNAVAATLPLNGSNPKIHASILSCGVKIS